MTYAITIGPVGEMVFRASDPVDVTFPLTGTLLSVTADGIDGEVLTLSGGVPTWLPGGSGSGSVTSVSVVSANGFAGSVATPVTTPAITLSTTVNAPVLAGDGTSLIAATTTGTG